MENLVTKNNINAFSHRSGEQMSKKQGVNRAILPSKPPKENSSLLLTVLLAISIPWFPWLLTPITSISAPSSCHLLLYMSVSSILSLVRTFFTGIKAHQGNPGWLHLKFLNYICRVFFQIQSHSLVQNGGHHSTDWLYLALLEGVVERTQLPVNPKAGPRQLEASLPPPLIFGIHLLPTITTGGAGFKDTALREWDVVKIIWIEYMTEPH